MISNGRTGQHGTWKPGPITTGPVRFGEGRKRLGAEASLTITRQDFGLTYSRAVESVPVVGDEVRIELDIEARTPRIQTTP